MPSNDFYPSARRWWSRPVAMVGLSLLAGVLGSIIFLIGGHTTGPPRSWEDVLVRCLIAGPTISIATFIYLLHYAKRDRLIDKYRQSVLKEFSVEFCGRTLELTLGSDDSGAVMIRVRVNFVEGDTPSAGELVFNVCFDRKGDPRITPFYRDDQHRLIQMVLPILSHADPPIIPIKWKSGVLTISDAGLEYTEGPYDLGPVADQGIVGNLTIVEGLKGVVDEIEAIWNSSNSADEQ